MGVGLAGCMGSGRKGKRGRGGGKREYERPKTPAPMMRIEDGGGGGGGERGVWSGMVGWWDL